MKRLQPVSLTVVSPDECRLRCRPRFDQIGKDDHAQLLSIMRQVAVCEIEKDDTQLESEFVFTFNENGAVLHDKYFFALTSDDDGELCIDRAVDCLALANERGVVLPDFSSARATPRTVVVDRASNPSLGRTYNVVFDDDELLRPSESELCEYRFLVQGGKGNVRTIGWVHGSYDATWERNNWTFASSPPFDLEPLLLAIVRLDEAIYLEFMPYALC